MNVAIVGASGLVGGILLDLSLKDEKIDKIFSFGRRSLEINHPKIHHKKMDLFFLEEEDLNGLEISCFYCCIGTTAKKTPNKETYRKIDLGIPLAVAKLCEKFQVPQIQVISALGANPKSKIFYNQLKGEMEEKVMELNISKTYILQPSLIFGERKESRFGEEFATQVFKIFSFLFIGNLKKYKGIEAADIATCMNELVHSNYPSGRINSMEITKIARLQNA